MRAGVAALLLVVACSSGGSELDRLAEDTCAVLADPETSVAARSLVVYESTVGAIDRGYTEEEFVEALRRGCGDSVIIGGDG